VASRFWWHQDFGGIKILVASRFWWHQDFGDLMFVGWITAIGLHTSIRILVVIQAKNSTNPGGDKIDRIAE
jgi:hypothetical protein